MWVTGIYIRVFVREGRHQPTCTNSLPVRATNCPSDFVRESLYLRGHELIGTARSADVVHCAASHNLKLFSIQKLKG